MKISIPVFCQFFPRLIHNLRGSLRRVTGWLAHEIGEKGVKITGLEKKEGKRKKWDGRMTPK